jgi:hypothetical protein
VAAELGRRAAQGLLELLGQLAGDEQDAVGAELFLDFVQELFDAVGGLVEDGGAAEGVELAQAAAARGGLVGRGSLRSGRTACRSIRKARRP